MTNFANNDVPPNQVVQLTAPRPDSRAAASSSRSTAFPDFAQLRALHKDLNVGQPPAPAAGLTGVTFTINTLDPQTEEASFDIKRRFGIDELIVYRTSTWVYDLRDLRMATVLTVLTTGTPPRPAAIRATGTRSASSEPSLTRSWTASKSAGDRSGIRPSRRRYLGASCRGE